MATKLNMKIFFLIFIYIYASYLIFFTSEYLIWVSIFMLSISILIVNQRYPFYNYKIVALKVLSFCIFLIIYFLIERLLMNLFLFGINTGFLNYVKLIESNHELTMNEMKIWSFIFSLYYPIYIFIFIKPFVNHLDKSIRNIKENDDKK